MNRERRMPDVILRLSVGLEDAKSLIADLEEALATAGFEGMTLERFSPRYVIHS